MLECHALSKGFGGRPVLDNFSARFDSRRTLLSGPNGRGKTLLLKIIAGAVTPDSGRVVFAPGAGREVVLASDGLAPPGLLTLAEVLAFESRHNPVDSELQASLIATLGLEPHLHKAYASLSTGTEKKASLLRALTMESRWLLLDEPFNGLDTAVLPVVEQAILADARPMVLVDHQRRLAVDTEVCL
ncbi:ATP-binding cassette domain-containing protein [Ferrimonas sp. YFM]|uniref:ABC transporter ATP-binding protein n=1 Tax=Ferrimonas sp. YFM TaxID=3028878 RepID=UPI0025746116|nr:ATP-binding cassette domain-containing protein [Ferrimonas sp. YFM]BDY06980.1 hypothetical protein F0521_40210 [Ferrimonas sp. YFM]